MLSTNVISTIQDVKNTILAPMLETVACYFYLKEPIGLLLGLKLYTFRL